MDEKERERGLRDEEEEREREKRKKKTAITWNTVEDSRCNKGGGQRASVAVINGQ